jgi:tripartite-type tricarboxylate transporter receptor subunit TctC
LTGAQFTQVPFKGTPAINAVLGGHVEAVVFAFSGLVPHANSGKIRILLTSKKMNEYPNVHTIGELGYKEELASPWLALYAPAGVPDEVKNVLVPAIKKAINDPELIAKINKIAGSIVDYKSPGELTKLMIEEDKTISAIAVKIGLRK